MTTVPPPRYQVMNADGFVVAEYDDPDHAVESAHDNAAQGSAVMGDWYNAWDTIDRIDLAVFYSDGVD
jgi:hypothetical protein